MRDCPEEVKEDRKCYNCGDIGHLSRDCPDDIRKPSGGGAARGRDRDERPQRVQECYR